MGGDRALSRDAHGVDSPQARILSFFDRRPILGAILVTLLDLLLSLVLTWLLRPLVPAGLQADFFTLIVLAVLTAIAVTLLGWWREAGFNAPGQWRGLGYLVVPFLAVIVLPLASGWQSVPFGTALYYLAGYGLTAFHEETLMRGVVVRILAPGGRARAVWLSALLFGLLHAPNLFVRSSPALVLAQMVGAGTSGVGLAALRLRTNTIWFVIAIHFFEDILLRYTRLPAIPINVAQSVILFAVGLYILWRTGKEKDHNETARSA